MDKLIELLKAHDWTYEYSDDQRAFLKGFESLKRISIEMAKLPYDEAIKVYNEYAPKQFKKDIA